MTPAQYCQHKAAKSGSSFYYSFLFLPVAQRQAIMALYAYCREIDDIVDECTDSAIARVKLAWWRNEIERLFQQNPQHPVTQALHSVISQYNLRKEYLLEIIDGVEMDLNQNQYDNFKDLSLYCHRVASIVGLLAAEIFGYKDDLTLDYARNLGMAFQLTNIIRDVREDLDRGRLYIPMDELERFKVSSQELSQKKTTPNIRQLLDYQTQRAKSYYENAFNSLPETDRYRQRSGIIMAEIYLKTLNEIELDGFRVLEQRVRLTPLRKFWIAWKIARREKKQFSKKAA